MSQAKSGPAGPDPKRVQRPEPRPPLGLEELLEILQRQGLLTEPQTREIQGCTGFRSQNPLAAHFGLGVAAHGIFEALAGFNEPGDRRIPSFGPRGLPPEQAMIAFGNEHDDGRIGARKEHLVAILIRTSSRVAAGFRLRRRTAARTR